MSAYPADHIDEEAYITQEFRLLVQGGIDLVIVVEDTTSSKGNGPSSKELYEILFNNLLADQNIEFEIRPAVIEYSTEETDDNGEIKLKTIKSTGKNSVLKHADYYESICSREGTNINHTKFFYLIDGDLEWVFDDIIKRTPNIFQIDAYCMENLLLTKYALSKLLSILIPKPPSSFNHSAEVDSAFLEIENLMFDLFVFWAARYRCEIEFKKRDPDFQISPMLKKDRRPLMDSNHCLSIDSINNYLSLERGKLNGQSVYSNFDVYEQQIISKCSSAKCDSISGKDYIYPHIQKKFNLQPQKQNFLGGLAQFLDHNRFADLKTHLTNYLQTAPTPQILSQTP